MYTRVQSSEETPPVAGAESAAWKPQRPFADPAFEADFRLDRLASSVPHIRTGIVPSIPLWVASYLFVGLIWGSEYVGDIALSAATVLPTLIAGAIAIRRGVSPAALQWFALLSNLVPIANLAYFGLFVIGNELLTMMGFLSITWSGVVVHRAPLRWSIAIALADLGLYGAVLVVAGAVGMLSTVSLAVHGLAALMTGIQVLIVAHNLDDTDRADFAQRRLITAQAEQIAAERARADELLANMLPTRIIARLKAGEERIADHHDEVSVLFADLVGFTSLAESMEPESLVALLDDMFSAFDDALQGEPIEKIKTVGDAYLAVCGFADDPRDHAERLVRLGERMMHSVRAVNQRRGTDLQLRIGIATGPVVAGVIGKRKFAYDLWSDTVNTAARMESHGVPGRIHIAETTKRALPDDLTFEDRGVIDVKGKGPMHTWFVTRSQSEVEPGC